MLEEIWDRAAYIVLAVAAPAVWYYLMPDFSPLSNRPLGRSITFDELVKPILWLVWWPAIGWWTISFLYKGITGRDYDEFWHPRRY